LRDILLVALIGVLLGSCTPGTNSPVIPSTYTNTLQPAETDTPTLAPSPTSTLVLTQVSSMGEDEIVGFMVDYIVKNEIEATLEIIKTEKPPMIKPPAQFIIIYSPISENFNGDFSGQVNPLDAKNAKKVWIYENGNLTSPADSQSAIKDYVQNFIENAPSVPGIFQWGYDEFGIVSISNNGQSAEVYLTDSCGSVCGQGDRLFLEKNKDGLWELKDTKLIWGS
jgi:hypothetical protein